MLAFRVHQPEPAENSPLRLEELPMPAPGVDQVLIKINACGVCHTDLHIVEGDITPPHLPITPGHQVVGEIVETGSSVSNLTIGDRVGVPWLYAACRHCTFCLNGQENLCPRARYTGFHVDGGFAQYMLAQADYTLTLPDGLADDQAAPLLCAGIIGYRSLRRAGVRPGELIGLFGFGASAHLAIQVARHWNCEIYVFTRSTAHQEHARQLGAAWVGSAGMDPPQKLDRAILFAPSGALVPVALAQLRPGGTLAINAIHLSPIPELPYALIYGERNLCSVANATYQDGVEFLQLAEQIPVRVDVQIYPFQQANQALIDLKHSRIIGEAVLTGMV
jgi:alcohol dehydrogenase, propanol-preferring